MKSVVKFELSTSTMKKCSSEDSTVPWTTDILIPRGVWNDKVSVDMKTRLGAIQTEISKQIMYDGIDQATTVQSIKGIWTDLIKTQNHSEKCTRWPSWIDFIHSLELQQQPVWNLCVDSVIKL